MAAKDNSNEIKIIRIYDAPVKMVWDAWVEPDQVAKWWGPRGFTITTKSKDVRTGGSWVYTMHGPDGKDWPNNTKFLEVDQYKRLVYDHGGNETQPPMFRVTVLFSELKGGKTKMDMTMAFASAEVAEQSHKVIKQANGHSTWDRLGEYLDKAVSGKEKFIIHRTFHTSVETMYDVWTDPKHIAKWLAPTGFNMKYMRADLKAGGSAFYSMSNDAGMTMYGRADYIEMTRPSRLVYTQQFCDANEKVSRHPMAPTWPETMITTVTFVQEDDEHTRVKIEWEPYGKYTDEELQTFINARAGMTQGWTGSMDKLEDYLEKV